MEKYQNVFQSNLNKIKKEGQTCNDEKLNGFTSTKQGY